VEAKALPTNDARVVVKFLKSLFSRFGTPRAIISDGANPMDGGDDGDDDDGDSSRDDANDEDEDEEDEEDEEEEEHLAPADSTTVI
ncbi:hypothetical protein Tco_0338392, partial [Tanacetum coccineum]